MWFWRTLQVRCIKRKKTFFPQISLLPCFLSRMSPYLAQGMQLKLCVWCTCALFKLLLSADQESPYQLILSFHNNFLHCCINTLQAFLQILLLQDSDECIL